MFDEFRLLAFQDLPSGQWRVQLIACPVPEFLGQPEPMNLAFTRAHLRRLRSAERWPSDDDLKAIGASVWGSLMTPRLSAALVSCLREARNKGRGLRIVLTVLGRPGPSADAVLARVSEMPLEALYNDESQYLATDLLTPVSRNLQAGPDREPLNLSLPLRVLVVVATPEDKPKSDADKEVQAMREALADLTGPGRGVVMKVCQQPTRTELARQLEETYHVLHFIGHGAFNVVGDDPTPRAYVCLIREGSRLSDPVDAGTLAVMLRNTAVRLVVLTACSSAAPTPDAEPYLPSAFDGVAQRLLAGLSGASAVVAMQFDLEAEGAVVFTGSFYRNLLVPGRSLDEVVTRARKNLVAHFSLGHRVWVTPTLYWRCVGGMPFAVAPMRGDLDEETLKKLNEIDVQLQVYRTNLDRIRDQPPDVRNALAGLRDQWQNEVNRLMEARLALLGETLRIWGSQATPGQNVSCPVILQLRRPGKVDLVAFDLAYDADLLNFVAASAGKASAAVLPAVAFPARGQLQVVILKPSGEQSWPPEGHDIGVLTFAVAKGNLPAILDLRVNNLRVERDGAPAPEFRALDGILFIEETKPAAPPAQAPQPTHA